MQTKSYRFHSVLLYTPVDNCRRSCWHHQYRMHHWHMCGWHTHRYLWKKRIIWTKLNGLAAEKRQRNVCKRKWKHTIYSEVKTVKCIGHQIKRLSCFLLFRILTGCLLLPPNLGRKFELKSFFKPCFPRSNVYHYSNHEMGARKSHNFPRKLWTRSS